MITEKEIQNELIDMISLKELVETYEEIAISRMRKIRSSVLSTRDFMIGLTQVFGEVSSSYKVKIAELMKTRKIKDLTKVSVLTHNGKTVSVLLSANTGLYGDIVERTSQLFLEHINTNSDDVVVIGRLGRKLMEDAGFKKRPITYFDLSDGVVDRESIHAILEHLVAYEKVLLYYGQFQNVVSQKPTFIDLYGAEIPSVGVESNTVVRYLFEPTLEVILEFFEKEILASLFEQTIQESNLAKYASRMVSLDAATDNIAGRIKDVRVQGRIAKHRTMNRKQLNALSGVSLWNIS